MAKTLVFGASYGSLFATKLAAAGHDATLVCQRPTAELINREGTKVLFPVKGGEPIEVASRTLPGAVRATTPAAADPAEYDLAVLAMQEPQYGAAGVRELLDRVAKANVPCLSLMNMPPAPYLRRIGVPAELAAGCYADPTVWQGFEANHMTLCSPDPQAFRPPEEKANVLQVRLPTNFKSARFESDDHTRILRTLETDIEKARYGDIELPVKLKVHDSVFVPLAKWAMLMAGNYRCIGKTDMRSIRDTVHEDLNASRAVYNWVVELCKSLGADEKDLVPFEKYAAAAQGLASPSSAARALFGGAPNIERVDRLVQGIAAQKGMRNPVIDEIVSRVDARLEMNRKAAKAA